MSVVHKWLAVAAATLGLAAAGADSRSPADATTLAAEIEADRDHIAAPDLAERIMSGDSTLQVFDLRSPAEYEQLHIPSARHATLADLARQRLPREGTIVLYSEGGAHSAQAWVLLRMRGYRNVLFLREGIYEWIGRVLEPRLAQDATAAERTAFERAAVQSRFFGGVPQAGVPRSDVPVGYWTGAAAGSGPSQVSAATNAIARIRRRGC